MSRYRVFEVLGASAAVAALIGRRIYPTIAPESLTLAQVQAGYAVFIIASGEPENDLDGEAGARTRVQVTAWAKDCERAFLIAETIRAALADEAVRVFFTEQHDPPTGRFGFVQDFELLEFED